MDDYRRHSKQRRSMRAEQSSKVSSLRYFHLVQPSPFYTPQYHKPASHQGRHTPTHRQSVLNTIATPSRGKRQKAADVLITSLLSSDEESGDGDDVIDNKDDVIVIDDDEEEEEPVVSNIIDRVSPVASTLISKAAAVSKSNIHSTPPIVYMKFQPNSNNVREERRASAAAVVDLFNNDSSEEDNDDDAPLRRKDPPIRPTPELTVQKTRKESMARDPLTGVARRGHVMKKKPLVKVSPMLVRNGRTTTEKRKQKNERVKTKVGLKTPSEDKQMRAEECVTDGPVIGANMITERRKEFVMEDPLAVISPKRSKLRSGQRKPPLDHGETPKLVKEIGSKEPMMEDPLARLSPPVKKRKLRSSRNKTRSTHGAAPRMIEVSVRKKLEECSDHTVEQTKEEPEKRKLRSSHRAPPDTFEVAPEQIEKLRRAVEDEEYSELIVELDEGEPMTEPVKEKRKTRRNGCKELSGTCTCITEDDGEAPGLMKEARKEKKTLTERRALRNRNSAPSEKNVLLAVNQMGPDKQTVTLPSSKTAKKSHQAQERNLNSRASTTTKTKQATRRSTRTATVISTQSSENDRPYMHDNLHGLSSESEWNTTDSDDDDNETSSGEEMETEVTKRQRTPLKPLNTVTSKSRKRPSPAAHPRSTTPSGGYANKRLKLSLSSRRAEKAKKLKKKVRTVEKKRATSPSAATTVQKRNGEKTATPLVGSSRRKLLMTPHIPQRKKMTLTKGSAGSKANQFEAAKERLHVSALPETIPCRENEFLEICNYVDGKLHDETGGCMYISGVPGTGKTATVREVGRFLKQSWVEGELPEFKFVEINGMRLTEPHRAYTSILKQLTGEDATPDHASLLLDRYFSSADIDKLPTVLLADELDLLWTRKQTVLYNLFDWPTRQHAKLIVLAVANTMDLPEKVMMNKVSSRLGLTRLTFQPYTFQQLQEIVTSRMTGLKVFEPDAIQLAARKVAAVSGDARRALDIARRATEIAQLEKGVGLVGIPHIDRAVQEMFSSAKIQAIRHASLHEKMFLKAVLAEFRRSGLEEAKFKGVHQQLDAIYKTEDMRPANLTELHGICCQLGACRLLLLERGRLGSHTRIRLNISQDDVLFALRTC